jgi:hypothetical protein
MTTLLVFDSELALSLASPLASSPSPSSPAATNASPVVGRFGTVYVGCRRVRPSSRLVQSAVKLQKKKNSKKKKLIQQEEGGSDDEEENEEARASSAAAAATTTSAASTAAPTKTKKTRKKRRRPNDDEPGKDEEEEQRTLSVSVVDGDVHDTPASCDTKRKPGGDAGKQTGADCKPDDVKEEDEDAIDDGGYYTFPSADRILSSSLVKDEIADLCGEREGVPPVALPSSMMRLLGGAFAPTTTTTTTGGDRGVVPLRFHAVLDIELSQQWATMLKDSMLLAETLRDQDDSIRKMPYVLEPEAWTRKRPETLLLMTKRVSDATVPSPHATTVDAAAEAPTTAAEPIPLESVPPRSWFGCQYDTTNPSQGLDEMVRQQLQQEQLRREMCDAAVVQLLHSRTHLHVSCGAKFGCDYLLYQGSRNDHHAFAGLRVLVPALSDTCGSAAGDDGAANDANGDGTTTTHFDPVLERLPLPTPYDMAGYVRGLNTAGKLALLATAVPVGGDDADHQYKSHDGQNDKVPTYRVAVVDLALKKVRSTTFRGASGTVMPKMLPKRPAAG